MTIEIKELRIKITVNEESINKENPIAINSTKWKELKSSIVSECTKKVLEQIKERAER